MQIDTVLTKASPDLSQRNIIHDLRNLFGIVASAKHVLEFGPERAQRIALLEAIEDAAIRGGEMTTRLLSGSLPSHSAKTVGIGACLGKLTPMARALAGSRVELDFEIDPKPSRVRMVPEDFEATILELIANAGAANASIIVVRSRRVGAHVWILISDDGTGMAGPIVERVRKGICSSLAHGTGLGRVRQFANACHGRLLVRSHPKLGTTIALILPTVLALTVREPDVRPGHQPHQPKEKADEENRQPAAA